MRVRGIVRNLDSLGRVCLPKEIRDLLGMGDQQPLEILVDGDRVILRKHQGLGCTFCGSVPVEISAKGKMICAECIAEITRLAK